MQTYVWLLSKNGWKHIIRIWNPWGHGEWKGPWSNDSPQWDRVELKFREAILNKDDGEFWKSHILPRSVSRMGLAIDALKLQQLLNKVIMKVFFVLHLGAFQNLEKGGSQILMTATQWLTLVMYT
ncbi:calpain-13 [Phaethornis superciliosus]